MFLVMLATLAKSNTNSPSLVDTHITSLLQNISICDLQILHDGLDFGNHNIPVKVLRVPQYSNRNSYNKSAVAINVLSFRSPQHKLSFLIPKVMLEPGLKSEPLHLPLWIDISVGYHMYHSVNDVGVTDLNDTVVRTIRQRYYKYGDIMFVIMLTTRQKNNWDNLVSLGFVQSYYNSHIFAMCFLIKQNGANAIC